MDLKDSLDSLSRNLTVCILTPTRNDGMVACETLGEAGIPCESFAAIETLCRRLAEGAGAALIAREALTPVAEDLLATTLSLQPAWSDLPVIVLMERSRSARPTLTGDLSRLNRATFLERPLTKQALVRAAKAALEWRERQYDVRDHLLERQRVAEERTAELRAQRAFVRGVLISVTGGKLILCADARELPQALPRESEHLTIVRECLGAFRARLRSQTEAIGFPPDRIVDLLTGAGEMAMNAIVHAGGGAGWIADDGADSVQVWIVDQGGGIAFEQLPQATLERGFSSAGTLGHGFWLALKTCDRLYLHTGPTGTTAVLEQNREKPTSGRKWWLAQR
jgi:anti-sigma regulatory factor (Ser/Thr protein kinase)